MTTCYMLIGVPGSGKTTYRDKMFKMRNNIFYASTDDIIESISYNYGVTYSSFFKILYPFALEIMTRDINRYMTNEHPFVWDQTNIDMKSRGPKIKMLKDNHYIVKAVAFDPPPIDVLKERLNNRPGKLIPWNVMESMLKKYEPPCMSEGFETVEIITHA